MDTDGEIRWVGTPPAVGSASTIFQNAVYLASGNKLYRLEFDGAVSLVGDYGNIAFHHNMDYGKRGLILEEDLPGQLESFSAEVDADGNVLKTWDLAAIISNAMIAGGDDPNQFVAPAPNDWFHQNAAAYRKSDNSAGNLESRELCHRPRLRYGRNQMDFRRSNQAMVPISIAQKIRSAYGS